MRSPSPRLSAFEDPRHRPVSLGRSVGRSVALAVLATAFVLPGCDRPAPPTADTQAASSAEAAVEGGASPLAAEGSEGAPSAGAEAAADGSGEVAAAADGSASAAEADPGAAMRATPGSAGPLEGAARERFWGTTEDPAPELLNATREDLENRHYLYCDEINLHILYPEVAGIGGAYAGVGSDQAYTFAGWMRADLVWLTDYDPWIGALHRSYAAFFEAAETPDAFREYWSDASEEASLALLRARWADREDLELIVYVFRHARGAVSRRLRRIVREMTDANVPSFVSDAETYTYVRELVRGGRVRPMLANLLDTTALVEIGAASHDLGVPIRVFYLSNAEDYWRYPDQFKTNFLAQFFDERSVIVRTNATKPRNGDYRYGLQGGLNFQDWLRQDYVHRIRDIWVPTYVRDENHVPLDRIDAEPFDRRAPR